MFRERVIIAKLTPGIYFSVTTHSLYVIPYLIDVEYTTLNFTANKIILEQ